MVHSTLSLLKFRREYVWAWNKIRSTPPGKYQVYGSPKLLFGKVAKLTTVGSDDRACVKVSVSRNEFNPYLNIFYPRQDMFWACDHNGTCRLGDSVLIRQSSSPVTPTVTHDVEKIVHFYGHFIDPISGRRVVGDEYEDRVRYKSSVITELLKKHGITTDGARRPLNLNLFAEDDIFDEDHEDGDAEYLSVSPKTNHDNAHK